MAPWLLHVYMDGVLGKGIELGRANGGRFEINQLESTDNIALVATQKKSCVEGARGSRWRTRKGYCTENE